MCPPRVGIVGAGQLARMTAQAAISLGIELRILATSFHESAAHAWPDIVLGSPEDAMAIELLASACDITTFDHELVDVEAIQILESKGLRFAPNGATMAVAQSKRMQRERFAALGLPVPAFAIAHGERTLPLCLEFANQHGWPLMIKADRGGYDGRGVWKVDSKSEATEVAAGLALREIAAVIETWVQVDCEVAIQIARTDSGATAAYPVVETVQRDGMLRELLAPATIGQALQIEARSIAERIAEDTRTVGLLAVELLVSDGKLIINEIATRPHNSGHHTIEGAVTSQFEQHVRAILGLPLGSTELTGPHVALVNAVGDASRIPLEANLDAALGVEGAHVHIYGKESRPGRKLGHVTVVANDRNSALDRARKAVKLLEGGVPNE